MTRLNFGVIIHDSFVWFFVLAVHLHGRWQEKKGDRVIREKNKQEPIACCWGGWSVAQERVPLERVVVAPYPVKTETLTGVLVFNSPSCSERDHPED